MSLASRRGSLSGGQAERYKVLKRISELIAEIGERIVEIGQTEKRRFDHIYNYILLRSILSELKYELGKKGVVTTANSFILPGALYIAKKLISGEMTVDEAARVIGSVRWRVRKLVRNLAYEKDMELVIPKNVSTSTVEVYGWVDHVGKDSEGNNLFMLTLYFRFPFDIHEYDKCSEYEPISFLFVEKGGRYELKKVFARVHYDIYSYDVDRVQRLRVLFTRFGHTPIVLDAEASPLKLSPKSLVDKAWIAVGGFITNIGGTKVVKLADLKERAHLFVMPKLRKTTNNPFVHKIHPYFVNIKIG